MLEGYGMPWVHNFLKCPPNLRNLLVVHPSPPLKLIFDEKTCLAVENTVKIRPCGEHCNSK
jgi:hypothetical protein